MAGVTGTIGHGLGLIYGYLTARYFGAIKHFYGGLSFFLGIHLDKAKAF
jgi:hypothetical protein